MRKLLLVQLCLVVLCSGAFSQAVSIHTYGLGSVNEAPCLRVTLDQCFIIEGTTTGYGNSQTDFYLMKTDTSGHFLWARAFGGGFLDNANSVVQTPDSGYLIVGYTNSFSGNHDYDGYIVRTDKNGDFLWDKIIGTADWDFISSVQLLPDSGFIIAGNSYGNGSGLSAGWVVKLNAAGTKEWEKFVAGSGTTELKNIILLSNGNYAACGWTFDPSSQTEKAFATEISSSVHDTVWTFTFNGQYTNHFYALREFSDAGLALTGDFSNDSVHYPINVRLSAIGTLDWLQIYYLNGHNAYYDLALRNDSIVNLGYSTSIGQGNKDFHLVIHDSLGTYLDGTSFGGASDETGYSLALFPDCGYVSCGTTTSYGPSTQSIYITRTDCAFTTPVGVTINVDEVHDQNRISIYPNPAKNYFKISMPDKQVSAGVFTVDIFTLSGIEVQHGIHVMNGSQTDISNLADGIYLVQISGSKSEMMRALLIKN